MNRAGSKGDDKGDYKGEGEDKGEKESEYGDGDEYGGDVGYTNTTPIGLDYDEDTILAACPLSCTG